MPRLRRILLPLLLSLAALIAAVAATLGTLWCARRDKPRRAILFAAALAAFLLLHVLLGEGLGFLVLVEGMYLMLFLFARAIRMN